LTKRKHIYDRIRAEATEHVAALDTEPGSLEEVMSRVNAWLSELRASGTHHISVSVGDAPGMCLTCGTPWPCKPAKAEYPRVGGD
jgi:hypothetical protein